MIRKLIFPTFIALVAFTNAFATTQAKSLTDCVEQLDKLITVTSSSSSLSAKDQQGLISKASNAEQTYLIGKTADALQKLNDFGAKLNQLEGTVSTSNSKISSADAQALRSALNNAIGCISSN